jgi:aspartyl-tRNA(Asn)/glutamyl-tRNA(Gln) amidotransferase subunit C
VSSSREEICRLAFLARLELGPEEEGELIEHLNKLLVYVEKINEVNTNDIAPTVHAIEVPSPIREDRVTNQPDTAALLHNAPAREGDFFQVPRIIA